MKKVKVIVAGGSEYWRATVYSWILEVKDILEGEYNIVLEVECGEYPSELPIVIVGDEIAFVGVPGEEGYLIEHLKHVLDKILKGSGGKD